MEEALVGDSEDQLSNQSQRLEEMECEQRSQSPGSIGIVEKPEKCTMSFLITRNPEMNKKISILELEFLVRILYNL